MSIVHDDANNSFSTSPNHNRHDQLFHAHLKAAFDIDSLLGDAFDAKFVDRDIRLLHPGLRVADTPNNPGSHIGRRAKVRFAKAGSPLTVFELSRGG